MHFCNGKNLRGNLSKSINIFNSNVMRKKKKIQFKHMGTDPNQWLRRKSYDKCKHTKFTHIHTQRSKSIDIKMAARSIWAHWYGKYCSCECIECGIYACGYVCACL